MLQIFWRMLEQVDAVFGATDTIALAASDFSDKNDVIETTSNIWFWW